MLIFQLINTCSLFKLLTYLLIYMKTLHIPLDDEKYEALKKAKGNRTWLQFIDVIIKNKEKLEER